MYTPYARKATMMIHKYGSKSAFKVIRGGSGVTMVNGVETYQQESERAVVGFVRRPKTHEVDGDLIIATDWLGNFTNEVEIRQGDYMIIHGERYIVTDARPLAPTGDVISYRPIMRRVAVNG